MNLFFVKRSNNINEVHYDAVVDRDLCIWKEPYVDYYWRDLAEGKLVYNEITYFQDYAYGIKVTPLSDTEIEIRLRPFESAEIDRPIIARLSKTATGCRVLTTITICNQCNDKDRVKGEMEEAEFQSAYIEVAGLFKLTYDYFDILGYRKGKRGSLLESDRLYERFKKNKQDTFTDKVEATRWQSGVVREGLLMGRMPMLDDAKPDTARSEK